MKGVNFEAALGKAMGQIQQVSNRYQAPMHQRGTLNFSHNDDNGLHLVDLSWLRHSARSKLWTRDIARKLQILGVQYRPCSSVHLLA